MELIDSLHHSDVIGTYLFLDKVINDAEGRHVRLPQSFAGTRNDIGRKFRLSVQIFYGVLNLILPLEEVAEGKERWVGKENGGR